MRWFGTTIIFAFSLLVATDADAKPKKIGSEFNVHIDDPVTGSRPTAASLTKGKFVVAWDAGSIYAQIFNKKGKKLRDKLRVNTYTLGNKYKATIDSSQKGDFVIAWESLGQDSFNSWGIYAQRFNKNGKSKGKETQVNTYTSGDQREASIAILSNGGFVVAWESKNDHFIFEIYAQIFDKKGAPVGGEFLVNENDFTGSKHGPAVVATDRSGFVIIWAGDGIIGQRFDKDGNKLGVQFSVSSFPSGKSKPEIIHLRKNKYVAVWKSYNQGHPKGGIYGQIFKKNGKKIGDEIQITQLSDYNKSSSNISLLNRGGFVVTWDREDGTIYGRTFDKKGKKTSNEFRVGKNNKFNNIGGEKNNTVTGFRSGEFVAIWDTNRQIDGFYEESAFGQRFRH